MKTDPMGESRAGQTPLSARIGTGSRLHRPIREALPFLLVLVFTLTAMGGGGGGGNNLAQHGRGPPPPPPSTWPCMSGLPPPCSSSTKA